VLYLCCCWGGGHLAAVIILVALEANPSFLSRGNMMLIIEGGLVLLLATASCGATTNGPDVSYDPVSFVLDLMTNEETKDAPQDEIIVIGAALPRTGTASLQRALSILGLKAFHMTDAAPGDYSPEFIEAFNEANPKPLFNKVLANGFNATLDFPIALLWKEQFEAFPSAKVILTSRSAESWAKSMIHLYRAFRMTTNWPWLKIVPISRLAGQTYMSAESSLRKSGCVIVPFNDRKFKRHKVFPWVFISEEYLDAEKCAEFQRSYIQEVVSTVPKENLLVFSAADGWEPLCNFLNVPVPPIPFPSVNTRKDLDTIRNMLDTIEIVWPFFVLLPLTLLIFCCRKCRQWRQPKQKQL